MPRKSSKLRNITLSADETLIDAARSRAAETNRSLNDAFREWLEQFTRPISSRADYEALMSTIQLIPSGVRFSREEANER